MNSMVAARGPSPHAYRRPTSWTSLQFCELSVHTYVSLYEFGEVSLPYVTNMRPFEQGHTPLICFESLFKVIVLFKEDTKVDDNLRSGYFQVNDPIIDSFGGLQGTTK